MGLVHGKSIFVMIQSSLLLGSSYAAPAAGISPSQASILSQQAYNLCLYKSSLGFEHEPCTSYGVSGLPPITTVITSQDSTATFIASFLAESAAIASPVVIDTIIDGTSTQASVGELGQGQSVSGKPKAFSLQMNSVWAQLGDVRVSYPTKAPESPNASEKELKRAVAKATKKTTAVQQPTTKIATPTTTTPVPPQTTTSKSSSAIVLPQNSTTITSAAIPSSTSKTSLSSSQFTSSTPIMASSVSSVSSVLSDSVNKPVATGSPSLITSSTINSSGSPIGIITGTITGSSGSMSGSISSTLSGSSTSTCIASTHVSAGSTYTAKCTGAPVSSSSTCTPSTYVTSGTTMTAPCKPTSSVCSAFTYVTSGSTVTGGCSTTSACVPSTKIVSGKTTVASCTQASVRIASWTTNKVEQNGVTATAFNSVKASSVASGIDALLSQWNGMGDNSTETSGIASTSGSVPKTAPFRLTTLTTSKVPLSTGAALKRRALYL
ncbi:hypothetical protein BGAL_0151g00240 [Botrytis galanthina]|uniref:Ig-like domain-containing protein n=1 Tax=Botrytis galanthina TaxID=278940 RepID=A0A4S8QYH6_9HELO|nr:hypothetical protein BGAL_0151g00240 [Botrytis galanthina]